MSEFAEPYAARVLCLLLGLPEEEWAQVAHWADDLGKSFGINLRQDLPRIEAALEGLTDVRRGGRRRPPVPIRATTWSAPWSPHSTTSP